MTKRERRIRYRKDWSIDVTTFITTCEIVKIVSKHTKAKRKVRKRVQILKKRQRKLLNNGNRKARITSKSGRP